MTFDKSKVDTALNADELRVGSRCIFADTIQDLKKSVERSVGYERTKLKRLQDDTNTCRFIDSFGKMFAFAYLIESPKESEYRPFENIEEAIKAIKEHGGWAKNSLGTCWLVTGYATKEDINKSVHIASNWVSLDSLYRNYVFADDGSPCGVLIEE